jgi:LCP family protein required for cell wall assembly
MPRQNEWRASPADGAPVNDQGALEELLNARARGESRTVRKAALGLLCCGLALLLPVLTAFVWSGHRLNSNIDRIDGVFHGLENRPARATGAAADALNVLLLGTDRRSDVPTTGSDAEAPAWQPGEQRSDTIMILHIDADRSAASLVSIPRDTWLEVPNHGWAKINAAFSWGGPSLAVETVEAFTGIHIDHLAMIDWAGFVELVDAVGGIDVTVPATVTDSARGVTWRAGEHHLKGEEALLYVGQRYGLPNGDLDRARRQQVVLRSLMGTALGDGVTSSPRRLYDFIDTITRHLSVDRGWSSLDIGRLAFSLRGLGANDVTYLMLPVVGFGDESGQSVVYADRRRCRLLWSAVHDDSVAAWAERHPQLITESIVD